MAVASLHRITLLDGGVAIACSHCLPQTRLEHHLDLVSVQAINCLGEVCGSCGVEQTQRGDL